MKQYLLFPLTLWILLACKDNSVNSNPNPSPIEKWKAHQIQNYTIDQSIDCFCLVEHNQVRITVRNGQIQSILRLPDLTLIQDSTKSFMIIDSLFTIIQAKQYDSIYVEYNKEYGFPELVDVNPQEHPVDGGIIYRTNNFKALP